MTQSAERAVQRRHVTVELPEPAALRGVIVDGEELPTAYRIEYSYDERGERWFPVPGQKHAHDAAPGPMRHEFPGVTYAQRLRLTAEDGSEIAGVTLQPIPADWTPPFDTPEPGDFDAQMNVMWLVYGSMQDGSHYDFLSAENDPWASGQGAVLAYGWPPAYHDWMALKYAWARTAARHAAYLRDDILLPCAQSEDGYMWSWRDHEPWPNGALHQDNNPKFILGAWRYWAWTRDDAFFDAVDPTTVDSPSKPSRPDVSQGKTVRQKLRAAMAYLESQADGPGGLLVFNKHASTNGTVTGDGTNYWDNWRFGHLSAYENAWYIAALEAMAQIEAHWGHADRARELRQRREAVRKAFDATFWDAARGRYVGCIDANGERHDYGFVFLNLEALVHGAGDAARADAIFDWLDGRRIVEGDTSTGADIYFWRFAPRANTLAAEAVGPPYWWDTWGDIIRVDTPMAQFGNHLENGGTIFYLSFYDLMARLEYLGSDNALDRLRVIVDEFRTDQLRRDPAAPGSIAWQLGILGENPESGLVPAFLVHGFAGLRPDAEGLCIRPRLPSDWPWLTIRQVTYAGAVLDVTVSREEVRLWSAKTSARTLTTPEGPLPPGGEATLPLHVSGEVRVRP